MNEKIIKHLKYNIETILECFQLNKDSYHSYYYPGDYIDRTIKDRKQSIEAARKFREKFNIVIFIFLCIMPNLTCTET
jgi:hypothetical protein